MIGPQDANWGGLSWSPWHSLDEAVSSNLIPQSGGVYRFRSRGELGLLYIGEGVNRRRRLRPLARSMRQPADRFLVYPMGTKRPHRGHYAAPYLRQCLDAGCFVEVSWANDVHDDRISRKAIEDRLITLHLSGVNRDPPCQFGGRGLTAYLQSKGISKGRHAQIGEQQKMALTRKRVSLTRSQDGASAVADLKTMVDSLIKENRSLKRQLARVEAKVVGRIGSVAARGLQTIARRLERALSASGTASRGGRRPSGSTSGRGRRRAVTVAKVRKPASPETQRKRLEALARARAARAAKKAQTP